MSNVTVTERNYQVVVESPTKIVVEVGNLVNLGGSGLGDVIFQQPDAPVTNVNEGDIWYNTTNDTLYVFKDLAWEKLILQTDLNAASLNGGYF